MSRMISFDGIEISEDAILAKGFTREQTALKKFSEKWGGKKLITSDNAFGFRIAHTYPDCVALTMQADFRNTIWSAQDAREAAEFFMEMSDDMQEVEDAQ